MIHDMGALSDALHPPLLAGGLLVAMALALAMLALASLRRRDRAGHGPTSRRVCRALRLSGPEVRLLARVARSEQAPGAGSLLVSRGYFDAAVSSFAGPPDSARRLSAIRRKVFG